MKILNKWVGYLDRSHLAIKNSVLKKLGQTAPEITDHSESNILVIIVSIFSGIGEQLSYYIDSMAREAFITTARKYSSVVKHTKLIDYRIKAAVPSSVDILVTLLNQQGGTYIPNNPTLIPMNTRFTTVNGIQFLSTKDVYVEPGNPYITIPAQQKLYVSNIYLGTTDGVENETIELPNNYAEGTMIINIAGEPWNLVDTLGFSGTGDKNYIIEIAENGNTYLKFGDGLNGAIPMSGQDIIAQYYITTGAAGNVDANTILDSNFDFTETGAHSANITNPLKSVGGDNKQSINHIRQAAPLSLRTLDRGVTKQDYLDIAKLAPGVDKSDVKFECTTGIHVYISPIYGGIAQTPLLESVTAFIERRKIIGRPVTVEAAGESQVKVGMTITPKVRRDPLQTRQDAIEAIITQYGYTLSTINRAIRKSDLYALVDNLDKVDWLNIDYIYTKPYFRPVKHYTQLLCDFKMKPGNYGSESWQLRYIKFGEGVGEGYFEVLKNHAVIGTAWAETVFGDPWNTFEITIQDNNYDNGQVWEFITQPYNTDQVINDNSVPIIHADDLKINIKE